MPTTPKTPVFFNELISFLCLIVNLFFLFSVASQPITIENLYRGNLCLIMGFFLVALILFSLLSTGAAIFMFIKTAKGDTNRKHALRLWLFNHAVFIIVLSCTAIYIQRLIGY